MKELFILVGERIRELRKALRLSQEELASRAELHHTYIGKLERGEVNIGLESLVRVLDVLHISLKEFFDSIDSKVPDEHKVLLQITEVLKNRSYEEQVKFLEIVKIFNDMVEKK
jgi:XRE family transcriptional regulator, regulator of sulfur utilization